MNNDDHGLLHDDGGRMISNTGDLSVFTNDGLGRDCVCCVRMCFCVRENKSNERGKKYTSTPFFKIFIMYNYLIPQERGVFH